jgi:hypothetical protein
MLPVWNVTAMKKVVGRTRVVYHQALMGARLRCSRSSLTQAMLQMLVASMPMAATLIGYLQGVQQEPAAAAGQ